MGVDVRRPPLPAPTEPSTLESTDNEANLRDDVDTNVSTRTDKTSYSIPEDGTPVTINTTGHKSSLHKKFPSQTSLLIEYFEGGKPDARVSSRPSVRVRVTPSSRKSKAATTNDHLQITQTSRSTRKPSYTRRISLGGRSRDDVVKTTETTYSEGSNISSIPPVEIEVLQNSDLSSNGAPHVVLASDVSSMPPDSMLGTDPVIKMPGRRRSRSLERKETSEIAETTDTLKAPTRQRSRSLSKERITQRVMEKLQQNPGPGGSPRRKERRTSIEETTSSRKSHRKSRGSRDEEVSAVSGTDSSLLSSNAHRISGDTHSLRSGLSGTSSINNPKLLTAVEDAIKRLILPELNALKEEQNAQKNRSKFERISRDSTYEPVESTSTSRDHSRRRVSKSSSAPHIHGSKPKVVLNRDEHDPGTILSGGSSRKERRSSRGSTSERSVSGSTTEERTRRRKSKDKTGSSARDAALVGLAGAGLTAAALKSHNVHEDKEERKERRKKHSRSSRSRSASISESIEDEHLEEHSIEVPPLPIIRSELQGSELTRDSILSAETETRERPDSSSSRDDGVVTPIHQVARGYASPSGPTPTRTPVRTPVSLQRDLYSAQSNRSQGEIVTGTPKSDRSYSSRSRDLNSAALQAAAAAKARAIERAEPQRSQYEIAESTPTRDLSPVQSEASYREEVHTTGSPRALRSRHSGGTTSSAGRHAERSSSRLSIQSFEPSPATHSRKRPQGVTLEHSRDVLGDLDTPRDVDEFFEKNHEQNELYRREFEASQLESPTVDHRFTAYTDENAHDQYQLVDKTLPLDQAIGRVGSNPEYVHTPVAVESAVASLHDPSTISVHSSLNSLTKRNLHSRISPGPGPHVPLGEAALHEHSSGERWSGLRDQAEVLAAKTATTASPRQSLAESTDMPMMRANAMPMGDMMPEAEYYVDDASDVTTNPSIIKGPLGGADYQTEELLNRQHEREQDRTPTLSYGEAALLGGAAGAALGAAAATHSKAHSPSMLHEQHHPSIGEEYGEYADELRYAAPSQTKNRTPIRSPAGFGDEGYQSGHPPALTPETGIRSRMLDDRASDEYDHAGPGELFMAKGHERKFSGNSHGMSSPLYDAATGEGIDHIQSKDVVALMDHLTVRDAQRNARDTEIMVTLVRSAAEMRNTFEEMKQFIRVQDAMIMNNTDKRVDLAEQRIISGPRPQPVGSPRAPRSSTDEFDLETKKKNVFKRALKGLTLKGDGDIKKIEAMLMQLLGEVEGLKQVHQLTMDQQNRSNSLTSYENLRAVGGPESGYEPEGRANTASSPDQSGYLSNPSSRRIQDMHSGYDVASKHRISTVQEDDEEFDDDGGYENTERMTTPTQEAQRNINTFQDTPPQASKAFRDSQSNENTPKRKHKSTSSSFFGGIPKMSRWSKTTASTNNDSAPRNSGSAERRPYSTASRSGSQLDVAYGEEQYDVEDDDRLQSTSSLARDERSIRSPSPLIPEDAEGYTMDDPKYQAHRNSLNLQHPQPRPGPTGRHQNHLESQAHIFDPIRSPDYDQWGSNPSLARNRLSGGAASQGMGNLSPISSEGGASSQHSAMEHQQAPPRPPKILDDGPLIPQQSTQQPPLAGHGQARQMYSSPNEYGGQGMMTPLAPIQEVRYSLETDAGHHHYSPTPSPRPNSLNPIAAMASPQRKITGPRPMGSKSPNGQAHASSGLAHSDTVIRRKPVAADEESLLSYRSSNESETF